jgi:hypothetical protein
LPGRFFFAHAEVLDAAVMTSHLQFLTVTCVVHRPRRRPFVIRNYPPPGRPRLPATCEVADNSWRIRAGTYRVLFGQAADDLPVSVDVTLPDMTWSAVHKE